MAIARVRSSSAQLQRARSLSEQGMRRRTSRRPQLALCRTNPGRQTSQANFPEADPRISEIRWVVVRNEPRRLRAACRVSSGSQTCPARVRGAPCSEVARAPATWCRELSRSPMLHSPLDAVRSVCLPEDFWAHSFLRRPSWCCDRRAAPGHRAVCPTLEELGIQVECNASSSAESHLRTSYVELANQLITR
jgi:hypothetical protein